MGRNLLDQTIVCHGHRASAQVSMCKEVKRRSATVRSADPGGAVVRKPRHQRGDGHTFALNAHGGCPGDVQEQAGRAHCL
eukprot:4308278-Prymnesium_polylepis.1